MKRHQRIAFYTTDLDPSMGGIERVSYMVSRTLASRGYEVYALYIHDKPVNKNLYSHYKDIYQGDSTRMEDIPGMITFIRNKQIELFVNQIFTSYSSVDLQQTIKTETSALLVDVLHTTPSLLDSLDVFFRPLPIPRWLNRMLFSIHKTINLKPRYRRGDQRSYELCDAFVLLSPHYISEFVKENKIKDSHKLSAIANPYEAVIPPSTQKEKIVLVVARLNNQQKRIDRTLRFWKKFHREGDGWKLMIVGHGWDKDMLIGMAEKLGLTDYSFEGHSDNPMDYYSRAMVFMMTSDVEGWGMTLIEAMSVGCVPVAMDCFSALSDIITDKQDGMIVAKDDIPGMVTATQYILDHFDEMSARARKSVRRYDVEAIANQWEELFNRL